MPHTQQLHEPLHRLIESLNMETQFLVTAFSSCLDQIVYGDRMEEAGDRYQGNPLDHPT